MGHATGRANDWAFAKVCYICYRRLTTWCEATKQLLSPGSDQRELVAYNSQGLSGHAAVQDQGHIGQQPHLNLIGQYSTMTTLLIISFTIATLLAAPSTPSPGAGRRKAMGRICSQQRHQVNHLRGRGTPVPLVNSEPDLKWYKWARPF